MAKKQLWKNVAVAMQSAIGAGITITDISKASTAVAQAAGHSLSNGDILFLEVQGMRELHERVVRVSGVDTGSFQLEGIDSTDFDDFISGKAFEITLGTSITTATTITAAGGDFDMVDATTIHTNNRDQIPGLPSASTFSMDHIWDVADTGLQALKLASDTQQRRVFQFTFGQGGQKMLFAGYVGANLIPAGQAQQLVTTPAVVTMNGLPTYYAA